VTTVRIERIEEASAVERGAELFDGPPIASATADFLRNPGHHLLFAYDAADRPVGMISGVETTHPDKGTEMFLYELGVVEGARRQGIATALVRALAALARDRGCYGMWVAVDDDNVAALAMYRGTSPTEDAPTVTLSWDLTGNASGDQFASEISDSEQGRPT
jgi:ribosomal protein S18 acetylase RimI-like enzyme